MQPWRETAKAPQALANLRLVGQSWSVSQPRRRPEKKPSPAPRTLKTSIGKPGPVWPSSSEAGIAPSKDDYALETYILSRDRYQIELLANLDQVPEAGAIAIVTFPKPEGGSGFPARVFAIVP